MAKPQRKRAVKFQELDERLHLSVSPQDAADLEAICRRRGLSKSALVRSWIRRCDLPPADDLQERLLVLIDNHLQFIARRLAQQSSTTVEDLRLMGLLVLLSERLERLHRRRENA
jgi:hypothetical protein